MRAQGDEGPLTPVGTRDEVIIPLPFAGYSSHRGMNRFAVVDWNHGGAPRSFALRNVHCARVGHRSERRKAPTEIPQVRAIDLDLAWPIRLTDRLGTNIISNGNILAIGTHRV